MYNFIKLVKSKGFMCHPFQRAAVGLHNFTNHLCWGLDSAWRSFTPLRWMADRVFGAADWIFKRWADYRAKAAGQEHVIKQSLPPDQSKETVKAQRVAGAALGTDSAAPADEGAGVAAAAPRPPSPILQKTELTAEQLAPRDQLSLPLAKLKLSLLKAAQTIGGVLTREFLYHPDLSIKENVFRFVLKWPQLHALLDISEVRLMSGFEQGIVLRKALRPYCTAANVKELWVMQHILVTEVHTHALELLVDIVNSDEKVNSEGWKTLDPEAKEQILNAVRMLALAYPTIRFIEEEQRKSADVHLAVERFVQELACTLVEYFFPRIQEILKRPLSEHMDRLISLAQKHASGLLKVRTDNVKTFELIDAVQKAALHAPPQAAAADQTAYQRWRKALCARLESEIREEATRRENDLNKFLLQQKIQEMILFLGRQRLTQEKESLIKLLSELKLPDDFPQKLTKPKDWQKTWRTYGTTRRGYLITWFLVKNLQGVPKDIQVRDDQLPDYLKDFLIRKGMKEEAESQKDPAAKISAANLGDHTRHLAAELMQFLLKEGPYADQEKGKNGGISALLSKLLQNGAVENVLTRMLPHLRNEVFKDLMPQYSLLDIPIVCPYKSLPEMSAPGVSLMIGRFKLDKLAVAALQGALEWLVHQDGLKTLLGDLIFPFANELMAWQLCLLFVRGSKLTPQSKLFQDAISNEQKGDIIAGEVFQKYPFLHAWEAKIRDRLRAEGVVDQLLGPPDETPLPYDKKLPKEYGQLLEDAIKHCNYDPVVTALISQARDPLWWSMAVGVEEFRKSPDLLIQLLDLTLRTLLPDQLEATLQGGEEKMQARMKWLNEDLEILLPADRKATVTDLLEILINFDKTTVEMGVQPKHQREHDREAFLGALSKALPQQDQALLHSRCRHCIDEILRINQYLHQLRVRKHRQLSAEVQERFNHERDQLAQLLHHLLPDSFRSNIPVPFLGKGLATYLERTTAEDKSDKLQEGFDSLLGDPELNVLLLFRALYELLGSLKTPLPKQSSAAGAAARA